MHLDDIQHDFDFDTWIDLFTDYCRSQGYTGPIDKYSFEFDWETGQTPEESARTFINEIND